MRIWPAALLVMMASGRPAAASSTEGTVVQSEASWAYGGTAIVTESVVEAPDGSRVRVHQLGGSAGGVGMRLSHAPSLLYPGDQVRLDTELERTPSGRSLHKIRQILELRRPSQPSDKLVDTYDFVQTQNSSGAQIRWKSGCALVSVASEGSSLIAGDGEFEAIDEVLAHWQGETRACSYLELINEGREEREVGLDGINLIKFREQFWCRPATDDDPQECYDQAAAGLTTLFFIDDEGSSRNGEIIDADVELNGVNFAPSVGGVSAGTQPCQADVANTLTHEIGHLVGLDHTCWTGGPRLNDDKGDLVPMCSAALGDTITNATMYNFQTCGETKKATLEADDIAGMCAIYPLSQAPGQCKPASLATAGCCSVAGHSKSPRELPHSLLMIFLAAFATLAIRAMRRSRNSERAIEAKLK